MINFKVGDIIKGTRYSDDKYVYTNSNMLKGKILSISDYPGNLTLIIKILEHKDIKEKGRIYDAKVVKNGYFEYYKKRVFIWIKNMIGETLR